MTKFISTPFAVAGAFFATAALSAATVVPAVATGENFRMGEMNVQDFTLAFEGNEDGGDDRGFVAMSGGSLIWRGDDAVLAVDGTNMTDFALSSDFLLQDGSGTPGDNLVTDVSTEIAYDINGTLNDDVEAVYTATSITPIGADANYSGPAVMLSTPISWSWYFNEDTEEGYECAYLGSGWGRVAVWDLCTGVLYDIDPTTGVVTTAASQAIESDYVDFNINDGETDSAVGAGILEYSDGAYSIVLPGFDATTGGLFRLNVSDPSIAPELVLGFDSNYDMSSIVISTSTGYWYTHVEGSMSESTPSENMSEALIRVGTFTTVFWSTAEEEEALAATGIEAGALAGAALMSILAGVVVAARRRARA